MDQQDQQQPKGKKLKGYQKNRVKYATHIDEFNLTEKSSLTSCEMVTYEERETTDMCFGICYLIFSIAFIGIAIFGLVKGNFGGAYNLKDGLTGQTC